MTTDRRLYLVSSQPGAPASAARAGRSHLRLVKVEPEAPGIVLANRSPAPASAVHTVAAPVALRPLARPWGERLMRVASDAAVFAVALLVGLRPNA